MKAKECVQRRQRNVLNRNRSTPGKVKKRVDTENEKQIRYNARDE